MGYFIDSCARCPRLFTVQYFCNLQYFKGRVSSNYIIIHNLHILEITFIKVLNLQLERFNGLLISTLFCTVFEKCIAKVRLFLMTVQI